MARQREFDTDAAVAAAMSLFRRKGYEGTSMRDLAEATGLGSGSLYAAFGSKDGLYLAALDLYRQQYAAPLSDMLRAGEDARDVIREIFVGVIDEIVRDGQRQACMIVGAAMERAQHDPRVADRLRSTTQSLELALYDTLAEGQLRGQIPDRVNASDLAAFLVTTLQGLRVMAAITPDRATLMRSVEVALTCLAP